MEHDLQILQDVQEWDREIYRLREELEEIPNELSELNHVVETEKTQLTKLQEELKNLQLKQKEKEVELASKEANVKKYEIQLAQVKTNKEYSSLQAEINSLKADNSLLEEAIIDFFDRVEAVQKNVDDQKKKLGTAETILKQKKEELDKKAKEIHVKINALSDQRKEKITHVNPEVASLYEKIVVKKRGLALVKVEGEVCPACQMQLRPQIVNEVKLKERVILCDNCSRILYSD
ncbi:MAG: hypothetical protein HY583_02205 [Candidatus Omnitrophica bacterium]|nr:hypothetical protein [Candidatus Omnitrophota bacterium]